MLDPALVATLHAEAHASRWGVDVPAFTRALEASLAKGVETTAGGADQIARYLRGLHLDDLALACACAAGHEEAWRHFVETYRPALYRAADAIDPSGNGRELADSLYADLFGLADSGTLRQSLFRYFHGRSSLSTWLKAILAQRHVDRLRARKRQQPIDEAGLDLLPAPTANPDPDRDRFVTLMRAALAAAMALLDPRDRLRMACYYARQMTLAQTGRLLGEHEATVSRHLARSRSAIREAVEQQLRREHHLSDAEISACFGSIAADTGSLDLAEWLGSASGKIPPLDRSRTGRPL
jgi:RNA polymerase sigma-70 factor (ECF subfamily)